MNHYPNRIMGMDVIVNPMCDDVPRMKVNHEFEKLMPPEFVSDLNRWMLEFFGRHNVTYRLGNMLIVGPKTLRAIKEPA